jgi:cell wall-associated NlpC family hydrolase
MAAVSAVLALASGVTLASSGQDLQDLSVTDPLNTTSVAILAAAAPTNAARAALAWALARVGTPYRWGGEDDTGFDCSGLVQAAFAAAGESLPRDAQNQLHAGPIVPPGIDLQPGDLVFFGTGTSDVQHVGIVVMPGIMVDAPHSGASVREEWFPTALGASWGEERYVGATRPAG